MIVRDAARSVEEEEVEELVEDVAGVVVVVESAAPSSLPQSESRGRLVPP